MVSHLASEPTKKQALLSTKTSRGGIVEKHAMPVSKQQFRGQFQIVPSISENRDLTLSFHITSLTPSVYGRKFCVIGTGPEGAGPDILSESN